MRFTITLMVWVIFAGAANVQASDAVLFKNVRVFDGSAKQLTGLRDVMVEANIISAIGENLEVPENTEVIEGAGRTLMPGLIDSHVHFNLNGLTRSLRGLEGAKWSQIAIQSGANARDHFMDGFTTVRDTCGMDNGLQQLIDKGTIVGPRIYNSAACISPTSGHGDFRQAGNRYVGGPQGQLQRLGITVLADSADEVRKAARNNFSNGAVFLKLMAGGGISSELDPIWSHAYRQDELQAAVEAAEFFDTYVMVHAYTDRAVNAAMDAGVKVIDHAQMVSARTVKRMVEEDIFWSLNLAGLDPGIFKLPNWAAGPMHEKVKHYHEESGELAALIQKYKPKIVFNTDAVFLTLPESRAHRDFEKFVFSNWFGNHALLRALTSTPGEMTKLTGRRNPYPEGKLGVIEEGAYADILLVDGNPLEDISVIGVNSVWIGAKPREEGVETIRVIMKDGVIYKNSL